MAVFFALLFGPAACSPRPAPILPPSVSPLPPTGTPFPSPTPTVTPLPSTSTPLCAENGTLEARELASDSLPAPLRFLVYLPPCYALRDDLHYPVLYLFHGAFYDETQWVRLGAPATADRLMASGEIMPLIMVLPFDPYLLQPSEYGFDEAILNDLLPYVDSTYRTLPDRAHRAAGGLSRGSSWALHFGLSRPGLFGEVGLHSPVVFASEGLLVERWLDAIPAEQMPLFYLDVSENDPNIQNTRWLEDLLTVRDIPHEWHLNTGFHEETYWSAHVEEYLRWYAQGWNNGR